jgi:hypothetical protein
MLKTAMKGLLIVPWLILVPVTVFFALIEGAAVAWRYVVRESAFTWKMLGGRD